MKRAFAVIFLIGTILIIMTGNVMAWVIGSSVAASNPLSGSDTPGLVIGAFQWAGYITAIGMAIWTGIKYSLAGAGEKSKAKETLVPLFIGAVIIATASTVIPILFETFDK